MKKKRRQRSPAEIARIIAKFHRSGQSQSAFTKKQGVPLSTFQYWLRKEREAKRPAKHRAKAPRAPNQLVPVRIVDEPSPRSADSTVELELAGGEKLRFPVGLSPDLLARYVEAVDRRC